ncbi:hypothetical protein Q7P37_007343 [Cladosporium fusiforme]
MQYTRFAVLAFALGATARSQRRQWGGGNFDWSQWSQDNAGAPSSEVSSGSETSEGDSNQWAQASGVSTAVPSSEASSISDSGNSTGSDASSAPAPTASASLSSGTAASGGSIPASSGSSALDAVQTIAAGDSFDGGMFVYDRGIDCSGQAEGGSSDAVFILENGASLSNIIIGPNQMEGVHCMGACKLENVWWSAVCEDAFTIKEQADGETTTITGGGAFSAEDKVLQHNGGGTLSVSGFTVDNFGKLYRSCGNCKTQSERHIILSDITATEGKTLVGINSNLGDTATLSGINVSGVKSICDEYTGTDDNDVEPEKVSSGPSDACIYSESDITEA